MIKYIFLKELQNFLLNRSMIFTWALIIVLFVLNTSVSVFQYDDLQKKHEDAVRNNRQALEYNHETNWMNELQAKAMGMPYEKVNVLPELVTMSQKISQPPSPLFFISGTSAGVVPNGADMRCFEEPKFTSFTGYNPYINSFFSIDWTTVMIYVISFLCICFSYNAFSGEREDGTLKLMLSNSLSRSSVIVAKFLGLLAVFLIPVLLGIVISCLIFEFSPVFDLGRAEYAKIAFFFLVSALLICLTILTGFLVSALTQKSYVSLIVCLVCWTMMAIVIPNASWIVSRQTDKIPTETSIRQEERQQISALQDCYTGWQGAQNTALVTARKECYDRRTVVHNSLWSGFHNMQFDRTGVAIRVSKISPFGLFRFLGDRISGNNYYGYASFFEQLKNYQPVFREYIIGKDNADIQSRHFIFNDSFTKGVMSQQKVNIAEVPEFTVKQAPFGEVAAGSLGDVAILCFWVIGLFVASFIAFIKYDVR